MRGLRLSLGLLTIIPVGDVGEVDRRRVRHAMVLAPVVGLLLGAVGAGVLQVVHTLAPSPLGSLLAAVLAVGALAYLTRALHLDGLADTADALGSGKSAEKALAIARRGDVGPFGAVTLTLVLLTQVTSLAIAIEAGWGALAIIVAVTTGRVAAITTCTRGIPPARPDGLGALVAGTVPRSVAAVWVVVALTGAGAAGAWATGSVWTAPLAVAAGLALALGVVARSVRRFGGITGDVIGAAIETASTIVLVILALTASVVT